MSRAFHIVLFRAVKSSSSRPGICAALFAGVGVCDLGLVFVAIPRTQSRSQRAVPAVWTIAGPLAINKKGRVAAQGLNARHRGIADTDGPVAFRSESIRERRFRSGPAFGVLFRSPGRVTIGLYKG
jgi:hypothetical protein